MTKKGWPQNLDNGVMKGRNSGPENKQGHSMNFYDAISNGENDRGQITIAPGQVVRGGEVIRDQEGYPRDFHGGSRWNRTKK